ncbi:LVIVD repeat-containing protein [Portibacter marinus]|uniref:LVIVD repeat-containing protein n=1 Tax=Portibacter marinus TaxID=2898660 RepID=UPI001F1593D0|nr:hypothetical protein [Portibacter marinus]
MKTLKLLCAFVFLGLLSQSCLEDKCDATREYVRYNPVYMSGQELAYDVRTVDGRSLENPGKIYFYQNYLFINEKGVGIHIYDNADPSSPKYVTFYNLPGNFDMAIKNKTLFADNPLFLMAINIEDIKNPVLTSRDRIKPEEDWLYENLDQRHVVYHTRSNIVETFDCSDQNFGQRFFRRDDMVWFAEGNGITFDRGGFNANNVLSFGESSSSGNSGVGGSFARFTIYDDYLYTVDQSSLNIWDIANEANPERITSKHLGWGIETIFPYQDKLFIGSNAGMFIFDNSDPSNPLQTAEFRHAQACDPVVVQDDIAYVTLRDGNQCNGFDNQLDVIDVSNIYRPSLIKSYDMKHPHGLAIRDNNLFICEGNFGLKVFDASDAEAITRNELAHLSDINAYDVISLNSELLFLVGSDGFFQYNVKDPKRPSLISSILVEN